MENDITAGGLTEAGGPFGGIRGQRDLSHPREGVSSGRGAADSCDTDCSEREAPGHLRNHITQYFLSTVLDPAVEYCGSTL